MVNIKIDTLEFKKGFDKACKDIENLVEDRMITTTEFLKAEVVKETPSDTGNLRASIFKKTTKKSGEIKGIVGSHSEYAPYVHQGTGVYASDGNGRKDKWRVATIYKGRKVFFWTTGQKPNPFLTRARDKNMGIIKKLLGCE
ncbi:HK97-gp10 family putative phage morphogenesis protein [uncultured Parvimonas sp.]|uniref:HK97-gp10 family putative phage morphogenesis protein n=1 Tax=uncultured Parvimonas sp. TaxID=747372 RepID=UPI0025966760|nr:HK97-gp10 family putative phage morphogenesis protein [uncultured Parvimonas sp.]